MKRIAILEGAFESVADVIGTMNLQQDVWDELVYASYDQEDYEGHALVVFIKDGKLFEVNASHCSCFGLEDQWKPEPTSPEAILMRPGVNNRLADALSGLPCMIHEDCIENPELGRACATSRNMKPENLQ